MKLSEQLLQNQRNEDAAREMYASGITNPHNIAEKLGCPVHHVQNWIKPVQMQDANKTTGKKTKSNGWVIFIVIAVVAYLIFKIFISKTITF